MELDLFQFIDEAIRMYDLHHTSFIYAERILKNHFSSLPGIPEGNVVAVFSRVKSRESLREKLLRNKFYLSADTPENAVSSLSDLVGITIECRFIRNEAEIYHLLFKDFSDPNEDGYAISLTNPDILLNLGQPQPQLQRNGFAIYRIDGRYRFNDRYIGFELQIKSLVHRFWSEIEHEVVYKNQEMVRNARFMRKMLGSIRDSLDVVDHQLETVYTEMMMESREAEIGIDERTFKTMLASSLNELFIVKMKETVGFSTSFKNDSEILAQYIYISDFLLKDNSETRMVEFLELLNELQNRPIDFRAQLIVNDEAETDDIFVATLSDYFLSMINVDFEWHAFFTILCELQTGKVRSDILRFTSVIGTLLIQPKWFAKKFSSLPDEDAEIVRNFFKKTLAEGMIMSDSVRMIHEPYLLELMNYFWSLVEGIEQNITSEEEFETIRPALYEKMTHEIAALLRKQRIS